MGIGSRRRPTGVMAGDAQRAGIRPRIGKAVYADLCIATLAADFR